MPEDYGESTYGERLAGKYDEWYSTYDEDIVELLLELSDSGSILELGIGTGRIALPLLRRGAHVSGIDSSPSMLKKLRDKKGGEEIPVTIGDFSDFSTKNKFDLIFVIFNTLFLLRSQQEQLNCFRCVSRALKENGKFVVEAFVPDLGRFDRGQTVRATDVELDHVRFEFSKHDAATQTVISQTTHISEEGIKLYPIKIRYAWPSELDLMAKLSGLALANRWGNWNKGKFGSSSGFHVSVYQKG